MTEKNKKIMLIIILHAGFLLPFIARIPGALIYGYNYFAQYISPWNLGVMISIFNFAPFVILAIMISLLGESKKAGLLGASITAFALDLYLHGTLDIVTDTIPATAVLMVPIYVTIMMGIGFVVGHLAGYLAGLPASLIKK